MHKAMKKLKNYTKKFLKSSRKLIFSTNTLMVCAGLCIVLVGVGIIWVSTLHIPDFSSFNDRKIVNSTKIYDRTGEVLLYDIHQDVKRTDVPFDSMSVNIKNATVAIEDAEFYQHKGVRVTSTIRAVLSNVFKFGIGGGGSTITQQLVKNTLLTAKKSPVRKIKEWVLAIKMEQALSKEKILELYLNEVPYGGTVYGIEEAAKTYFNKHASDLTIAESAYLASIPQSPSVLSPYGRHLDKLEERKNLVLFKMASLGFITKEEQEAAKKEVVVFMPQALSGIKAPHFVFFIKDYLENTYGADMVEKGGLRVTTTLDYNLEQKAEEIVKAGALENEKNWNGSNAALVAIDPKTGQILTMVGSRDYFDKNIDGNFNVATAVRQPGSSFKPFIYATAFNKGFTPDTVLFDVPTEFQTTCNAYGKALPGHKQSDCYMPDNADGKTVGPISLRNALAQSRNIPAVKLFYLAGLRDSLKTAEDMGISTLSDIGRYGLTLVIGGGEVTLLDMTSAYSVFANSGVKNNYTGILKVEDSKGNILEQFTPSPVDTLPKNTALTISDILSDNTARVPTFGANSPLYIPGKRVAAKTGTTNNNKDAWTIGYTPSIAVGVWSGNNDNKPMKKGGSALAGPIWNKFMTEALKVVPDEGFEAPYLVVNPQTTKPALRGLWQGGESFFIDKVSGGLATVNTPQEVLQEKVITNVHSILYWVDKNNITGPAPTNPENDSQFTHWEIPVQNWWANNKYKYPVVTSAEKPFFEDNIHTGANKPRIEITEPNKNITYSPDQTIPIEFTNLSPYPLRKIDVFINDVYVESLSAPFQGSFTPRGIDSIKETNELRLIVEDTTYNKSEFVTTFRVSE
jgi:penicillin-binding protein 1C